MKAPRLDFFLGALAGAALGALLVVLLRRRRERPCVPYATPPKGGEREGEHELFVG